MSYLQNRYCAVLSRGPTNPEDWLEKMQSRAWAYCLCPPHCSLTHKFLSSAPLFPGQGRKTKSSFSWGSSDVTLLPRFWITSLHKGSDQLQPPVLCGTSKFLSSQCDLCWDCTWQALSRVWSWCPTSAGWTRLVKHPLPPSPTWAFMFWHLCEEGGREASWLISDEKDQLEQQEEWGWGHLASCWKGGPTHPGWERSSQRCGRAGGAEVRMWLWWQGQGWAPSILLQCQVFLPGPHCQRQEQQTQLPWFWTHLHLLAALGTLALPHLHPPCAMWTQITKLYGGSVIAKDDGWADTCLFIFIEV